MAWALFFEAKRREEAGHQPAGTKLRQRHCGLKATASAMVHRLRGRWVAGLLRFKETPAHRRTDPVWRQANGARNQRGLGDRGGHIAVEPRNRARPAISPLGSQARLGLPP
jgi:hypothetical protein